MYNIHLYGTYRNLYNGLVENYKFDYIEQKNLINITR